MSGCVRQNVSPGGSFPPPAAEVFDIHLYNCVMKIETNHPPSATVAGAPVAEVETDAFCSGCGYNLHGQIVTRDERLQILLCRCPECGRFSPAATLTSVSARKQQQGALVGVVFYIGFLVYALCGAVAAMAAVQSEFLEELNFPILAHFDAVHPIAVLLLAAVSGAATGIFLSIFFWHWRARLALWAALAPVPIGIFVVYTWVPQAQASGVAALSNRVVLSAAMAVCVESFAMIVGLRVGRRIGRAALWVLLPASTLQRMAFLWLVDGKQPPSPTMGKK